MDYAIVQIMLRSLLLFLMCFFLAVFAVDHLVPLEQVVEPGYTWVQLNFGFLPHYGEVVPEDAVDTINMKRLAAEQGNADARSIVSVPCTMS